VAWRDATYQQGANVLETKLEVVVMPVSDGLATFFATPMHTMLAFGAECRGQGGRSDPQAA